MRLVVTGRHQMPALIRSCGLRIALHLDASDLAMRDDDARRLIHRACPELDMDTTAHIVDRAEGWPAALAVAGVLARQRRDADWLDTKGPDVLFADWFAALPEDLQAWLLATSVLDELSVAIADACFSQGSSAEALEELALGNGYLSEVPAPAGHEGRWWRRHGLLTTYLRQRGTNLAARHARAASWFLDAGDVHRGLAHLIAAGDLNTAGTVLRQHEQQLFRQGEAPRLSQWYEALLAAQDTASMDLLREGWGQALSGQFTQAMQTCRRLEATVPGEPATGDGARALEVRLETDVLRSFLAGVFADPGTMLAAGRRACVDTDAPATDGRQLAPLLVARGLLWSGREADSVAALSALAPHETPTDVIREMHGTALRALASAVVGDIHTARSLGLRCDQWLDRQGLTRRSLMDFTPELVSAWIAYEAGDLDVAQEMTQRTITDAHALGHVGFAVVAGELSARVAIATADLEVALDVLAAARESADMATPNSGMVHLVHRTHARVLLLIGDTQRAARIVRGLPTSVDRSLLWAWLQMTHRPATSIKALESLRPDTARSAAERQVLLARAQLRQGRSRSIDHLRKAAQIAERHGLGSVLYTCEPALIDLAEEARELHHDDAIGRLLATRRVIPPTAEIAEPGQRFTSRELQVIELLPTRMSNADIAAHLSLSVNTIKTRLKAVYAKLGASNRNEAVESALRQGLLR